MSGRQSRDDLVLVTAMGLLLWLIGYISAWFLFRRGWFLPAAVLPGIPIALNLGGIEDGMDAALLIYVLLALSLAAVQVARLRTAHWRQSGLAFSTIAWRAPAIGGAAIALLAVALVWTSPIDPPESLMNAAADRLDAPISAVESVWDDLNERLGTPSSGGGFSQFGDSFEMGGELNLSDEPVALLEADRPHYLAAQRYDIYTGQGWTSSAPDQITEVGSGETSIDAPLVAFQADQEVLLSDGVMGERSEVDGTVHVLSPSGNLLLTIESFGSADEAFSATVSWRALEDERFDLTESSVDELPVELRNLAILLKAATFVPGDAGLVASDRNLNVRIEQQVQELRSRYLSVRVTVNTDGRATALYATGYVPNYDDIESVSSTSGVTTGDTYSVTGWQSSASADQLREAPASTPSYIRDRYLGLSDSVTDETRGLALSITQGTDTVFDTALAIQTYLRATYPYEESISGPSDGVDAVHYFLFDEQQGYCEYFASAMVVMLRSLDIPTRLVSGLMEVPYDADQGGYLYLQKQAHTWVEVYFDGYGWIAFEPTPSRGAFDYEGETAEQEPDPTPTPLPVTPTVESEPTVVADEPTETPASVASIDQNTDSGTPWMLGGFIALGLVSAGGLFWLALRMNRGVSATPPAARYYKHLIRSARGYGILPTETTTPRELASRINDVAPAAGVPAEEISRLYRKEYYGGQMLTPDDENAGDRAVKRLRQLVRSERLRRKSRTEKPRT